MQPYSAAFISVTALVLLSPLVAIACVVLLCVKQWRRLGVQLLLCSLLSGVAISGLSYAVVSLFAPAVEIMPRLGLALFAAGFSVGAGALGAWLLVRRVLSNPPVNTDARASTVPDERQSARAGYWERYVARAWR